MKKKIKTFFSLSLLFAFLYEERIRKIPSYVSFGIFFKQKKKQIRKRNFMFLFLLSILFCCSISFLGCIPIGLFFETEKGFFFLSTFSQSTRVNTNFNRLSRFFLTHEVNDVEKKEQKKIGFNRRKYHEMPLDRIDEKSTRILRRSLQ